MIENIANPVTPAQKSQNNSPAPANSKTAAAPSPTIDTAPISPRLRFDAISGVVVTEFLKHGDVIQAQVPSAAVLAYLRAGLNAEGLSKNEVVKPHDHEAPANEPDASVPIGAPQAV